MFKKRLLKLAAYMEKVQPKQYRQDAWLTAEDYDAPMTDELLTLRKRPGTNKIIVTVKEGACGTAACVLGNAVAAVPEAKLRFYTDNSEIDREKDGTFSVEAVGIITFTKDGRELQNFEAGAEAFGISFDHASILFGIQGDFRTSVFYGKDFTPANVAACLRKYVESNGASING